MSCLLQLCLCERTITHIIDVSSRVDGDFFLISFDAIVESQCFTDPPVESKEDGSEFHKTSGITTETYYITPVPGESYINIIIISSKPFELS